MTSKVKCPWCDSRPSADGLLCQGAGSCTERLERALGDVRALEEAAAVTYRRAARLGAGGGPRDEAPIPFDPRIKPAVRNLARCVDAVASMVRLRHGVDPLRFSTFSTAGRVAGWLTTQHQLLRRHVSPSDLRWFDDLLAAVHDLEQLVDLPADRWYAGQCNEIVGPDGKTCDTDLYATERAAMVECPSCGMAYLAAVRREVLAAAAVDVLATATDLSRALTTLGQPVTPERVRKWAERGRLAAKGRDRRGYPTYRVGDVQELLGEDERRGRERTPLARAGGSA